MLLHKCPHYEVFDAAISSNPTIERPMLLSSIPPTSLHPEATLTYIDSDSDTSRGSLLNQSDGEDEEDVEMFAMSLPPRHTGDTAIQTINQSNNQNSYSEEVQAFINLS
jgi:hypothetical protein